MLIFYLGSIVLFYSVLRLKNKKSFLHTFLFAYSSFYKPLLFTYPIYFHTPPPFGHLP